MIVALLSLMLTLLSVVPAKAQWTNKPAGFQTVLDCPMNTLAGCGIQDQYGGSIPTTDSGQTVSPNGAVKSTMPAGASVGGGQWNYSYPLTREIFVAIEWHTNPEFQGRTAADKMFFVRGPSSNGFFGMLGGLTKGGTPYFFFGHNSGNVDNSHACAFDLGLVCNPNVGSGAVPYGVVHKLEVYMKSSSTNTSRDGVLRYYVNGVPAGSYSNLNLASAGFNEWNWTETWDNCGGNPVCDLRGNANTREWSHFVGHLHIATCSGCPVPSGGTGGGTAPPPPPPLPPNKPTNLRVQ